MDNGHDSRSLKERMLTIRDLRRQFGDAAIPKDILDELRFSYFEDEEGVVSYVPKERLQSLELSEKKPEPGSLPKVRFTMECATNEAVGLKVDTLTLRRRLKVFCNEIFDSSYPLHHRDRANRLDLVNWVYGTDSPLAELQQRYPTLLIPENHISRFDNGIEAVRDNIDLRYVTEFGANTHRISLQFEQHVSAVSLAAMTGHRVADSTAHEILQSLQLLRGKLGDVEEIEHYFKQDLSVTFNPDTQDWIADPDMRIAHQTAYFAQILSEEGFIEAAGHMKRCDTLEGAREVIRETLRINEHVIRSKSIEKEWRDRRKQATDEDEIHRLNVERSTNGEALKKSMRTIRGLGQLLNYPANYSQACLSAIKKMEELLITKGTAKPVEIMFDTAPDAAKDKNPGAMSGDCTDGVPLKFGAATGMRNVKVYSNGQYVGNMYVLESKTTADEQVWHIDAIQIPIRQVEWSAFPQQLIDVMAPIAQASGVSALTINRRQHHVSNYDYVAKGFMDHFGTGDNWKEHEVMHQPDDGGNVSEDQNQYCEVDFDRYDTNAKGDSHSKPQGEDDVQLYLWRA